MPVVMTNPHFGAGEAMVVIFWKLPVRMCYITSYVETQTHRVGLITRPHSVPEEDKNMFLDLLNIFRKVVFD